MGRNLIGNIQMLRGLAALCLHSAGFRLQDRITMAFGSISYALYLVHPIVLETMRAASTAHPMLTLTAPSGLAISVLLSLALAAVVFYGFERPVLSYLRKATEAPRATQPVPAVA